MQQEKVNDHMIKNELELHKKVFEQNGRRVPLQLQESVQKATEDLLLEEHIQKVRTVNNEMFFQQRVNTIKKIEV